MSDKTLSVFIDESGDFGPYEHHSPVYLVALVLHDQNVDIGKNVAGFEAHLRHLGQAGHVIHTGPLIRRESDYADDLIEQRRRLFSALFNFIRKLDIRYACVKVRKRECGDEIALTSRIAKQLGAVLDGHREYFSRFDRVIVYYDNGQINLTRIISSVFSSHLALVEFRRVQPAQYRLFQAADMICAMELLLDKAEARAFSRSELAFFDNIRSFKKNYAKWLLKKKL